MRLNTQSAALCLLLALSSCAQNGIRDMDGDGYTVAVDCDDGDESVGAPRPELCNGIDDDCDGAVDEDAFGKTAYWADADGDGFGAAGEMSVGCIVPTGSALFGGDCDDHDAAVHPDAVERCNGRDDDCDGAGDEGAVDTETWFEDVDADGFGGTGSWLACDRPPGFVGNSSDCDDRSAAVNPDAGELCNGVDDDCDAVIDEEVCP